MHLRFHPVLWLPACLALSLPFAVPRASAQAVTAGHPNPQLFDPATERRIDALLRQMTLDEKLGQLVQYVPTFPKVVTGPVTGPDASGKQPDDSISLAAAGRLGSLLNATGAAQTNQLQHAAVDRSRLHIPLLFGSDVIHGFRTVYPIPLALAATFDPDLVRDLTHIAGQEAATAGVRWVYSPMVDIARDPRWGRVMEGAGEDPFLGAAFARASTEGYQGARLSDPGSVAACIKHFAAYGAVEAGRDYAAADMSPITLRQVYLPPYRAAIAAGAASVMSAFNTVNGVPSTGNRFLLTQILRDEWRFDGAVVSDYGAIGELVKHGVVLDEAEAGKLALTAGVDVEMMSRTYQDDLPELVASGAVSMATVDLAVRRVLRMKFALGLFDHPYVDASAEVLSAVPAHRPLARRGAEESFVLLQNHPVKDAPLLPLPSSAHRVVALIGPLADAPDDMLGGWAIAGKTSDVVTPRQALERRIREDGGRLIFAEGVSAEGTSEDGIPAALEAARQADVVLLALGEPQHMQGEATSRVSLDLPGHQLQLLQAVAALGKPTVLVLFSSRPLLLTWAADHVPAILQAWVPGVEAGPALASVLFGDTSPSGRLPISFPRSVGQEPMSYSQLPTGRPALDADLTRPPTATTRYFSRYIDSPNAPLFPFGFGLSYTHFAYSDLHVSRNSFSLRDASPASDAVVLKVTATVTNTGKREAVEVAQLYLRDLGTSVSQPVRLLKGFQRVKLAPGASATVSFNLSAQELGFYNNEAKFVLEPSRYTFWVGGDSNASLETTVSAIP